MKTSAWTKKKTARDAFVGVKINREKRIFLVTKHKKIRSEFRNQIPYRHESNCLA